MTRTDGGGEPQSLVPNTRGLNPKFLRSAYDVKAYLLLIAIRLSDGDVKSGGLLCAFPFALSHLIFIIHTLHHNTTLHTLILETFSILQLHIIMWIAEVMQKMKMSPIPRLSPVMRGPSA